MNDGQQREGMERKKDSEQKKYDYKAQYNNLATTIRISKHKGSYHQRLEQLSREHKSAVLEAEGFGGYQALSGMLISMLGVLVTLPPDKTASPSKAWCCFCCCRSDDVLPDEQINNEPETKEDLAFKAEILGPIQAAMAVNHEFVKLLQLDKQLAFNRRVHQEHQQLQRDLEQHNLDRIAAHKQIATLQKKVLSSSYASDFLSRTPSSNMLSEGKYSIRESDDIVVEGSEDDVNDTMDRLVPTDKRALNNHRLMVAETSLDVSENTTVTLSDNARMLQLLESLEAKKQADDAKRAAAHEGSSLLESTNHNSTYGGTGEGHTASLSFDQTN